MHECTVVRCSSPVQARRREEGLLRLKVRDQLCGSERHCGINRENSMQHVACDCKLFEYKYKYLVLAVLLMCLCWPSGTVGTVCCYLINYTYSLVIVQLDAQFLFDVFIYL